MTQSLLMWNWYFENKIPFFSKKYEGKFVNIVMQRMSESFSLFIFMFISAHLSFSFIKLNSFKPIRFFERQKIQKIQKASSSMFF